VRGALDALPLLPLSPAPDAVRATRTGGIMETAIRLLAPTLAPISDNSCHLGASAVNTIGFGHSVGSSDELAVSALSDKRKEPLTIPVSGSLCRGDWIRTSDPLIPIQKAAFKKGCFFRAFSQSAVSRYYEFYEDCVPCTRFLLRLLLARCSMFINNGVGSEGPINNGNSAAAPGGARQSL
jgi:hypothetical protein